MSALRKRIIRLAYQREDLRPHLLPLLKEAEGKTAGEGWEIFRNLVDYKGLVKAFSRVQKAGDSQTADLLRDVMDKVSDELNVDRGTANAISRLRGIAANGDRWDPALIRNNVFKAANELGMKLPSAMF